jgi:hypothetical protein
MRLAKCIEDAPLLADDAVVAAPAGRGRLVIGFYVPRVAPPMVAQFTSTNAPSHAGGRSWVRLDSRTPVWPDQRGCKQLQL